MNTRHSCAVILLLCGILLGCPSESKQQQTEQTTMNNEMGLLAKLISLPKQPIKVRWEADESSATDSNSLVALLQFNQQDYEYVVSNSPTTEGNINDSMDKRFYQQWVPEDLQSQIQTRLDGERYELTNIKRREPILFTQAELSPYKNGSVTALGQGYILVSLYTM